MKISLNYVRKFLDFDLPPIEELIEKINAQLGALEEGVVNLEEVYREVIVAKVMECAPIEGSDHLNLCKISDGGKHKNSSIRDSKGHIQVVCGAENVASGQLIAWLPPGSIIPSTHFKDKVVLASKELKGHISHGMIASPRELAIDDDHSGILLIDVPASPGDSFAKLYELDDYILDIENKMFTHRPDCFGLLGIAREIAGIMDRHFKSPQWYRDHPQISPDDSKNTFKVENEIPSLVPRFSAQTMDNLKVTSSPVIIRSYLSRLGIRPVNSIVDATNLAMIETGQPLHAYDFDKLKELSGNQPVITIRNPKSQEKLTLINDMKVEPDPESIVIAANVPVGLGGVMGSSNSAISSNTSSILLESASFDMYSIRKTSMKLGIFSDAVTRFTKGQSPLQTARVLYRAIELIKQICGPDVIVSSPLVDINHLPEATVKRDSLFPPVKVKADFINTRLGTDIPPRDMASLLSNVECVVSHNQNQIEVTSPFWRTDLEIREDIVEEVGRLYGFNRIKMNPVSRKVTPTVINPELELKDRLRQILSSLGSDEVLTYSFVSKNLLNVCSQDEDEAYKLSNPISPEIEYYRLSLLPSILSKVHMNIKAGYPAFSLFEIGKSYALGRQAPIESKSVALVYAAKDKSSKASFYAAMEYLNSLLFKLPLPDISFEPFSEAKDVPEWLKAAAGPFNHKRSAVVRNRDKKAIGIVGEFNIKSSRELKLPYTCAGFEINLDELYTPKNVSFYHKLSKFPPIKQDITLKLPSSAKYSHLSEYLFNKLYDKTKNTGHFSFALMGIYQSDKDKDHLNYTFRITLTDYDRTLKDKEVNDLLDDIASDAKSKLKAERV